MAGTIDQIDTTELFAQYNAQWELLKAACDQDADAVISAWEKLNAVKKVNGIEPVGGNILLALNNIPDGGGYYKSPYYIQAGKVTSSTTAISVSFPQKYSSTPYIFLIYSTSTNTSTLPTITSSSSTGFEIKKASAITSVNWIAFGTLA